MREGGLKNQHGTGLSTIDNRDKNRLDSESERDKRGKREKKSAVKQKNGKHAQLRTSQWHSHTVQSVHTCTHTHTHVNNTTEPQRKQKTEVERERSHWKEGKKNKKVSACGKDWDLQQQHTLKNDVQNTHTDTHMLESTQNNTQQRRRQRGRNTDTQKNAFSITLVILNHFMCSY